MKGAIAVPCVNNIKPPNKINTINNGANQNFFLTFMNIHNSFISDSILSSQGKRPFFKTDF